MLPGLPDRIPPDQVTASVTADGAFDTRKCHDAIAARGAAALAIGLEPMAPRRLAPAPQERQALEARQRRGARRRRRCSNRWATADNAAPRNGILRTSKRVGRTIWRRRSGYRRRSRAEPGMHCVKLPGQRLSARQFDRQVAEFGVRVAVLDGFTALGSPVTAAVGKVCPG